VNLPHVFASSSTGNLLRLKRRFDEGSPDPMPQRGNSFLHETQRIFSTHPMGLGRWSGSAGIDRRSESFVLWREETNISKRKATLRSYPLDKDPSPVRQCEMAAHRTLRSSTPSRHLLNRGGRILKKVGAEDRSCPLSSTLILPFETILRYRS